MRSKKFRAWCERKKYMSPPATLSELFKEWFDTGKFGGDILSPTINHLKFLQYTGLKDKNGKEIYEGDILKYADICCDEWIMEDKRTVGQVKWIDYKCAFFPQEISENHRGGNYIAYWDQLKDIEVIGNIYENPELLQD